MKLAFAGRFNGFNGVLETDRASSFYSKLSTISKSVEKIAYSSGFRLNLMACPLQGTLT
jgi:hypothetical protein